MNNNDHSNNNNDSIPSSNDVDNSNLTSWIPLDNAFLHHPKQFPKGVL